MVGVAVDASVAISVGVRVRVIVTAIDGCGVRVIVRVAVDVDIVISVDVGVRVPVKTIDGVGVRVIVRVAVAAGVLDWLSVIESNAVAVRPFASRYFTYTIFVPAPGVNVQFIFDAYNCHLAFAKSAVLEI